MNHRSACVKVRIDSGAVDVQFMREKKHVKI